MEAMQQYYRLMKSILFVLFLSFGIISCEKEDPVSTSPNTRQTDNTDPTDPDPTDPVVRSDNEQTVFSRPLECAFTPNNQHINI